MILFFIMAIMASIGFGLHFHSWWLGIGVFNTLLAISFFIEQMR